MIVIKKMWIVLQRRFAGGPVVQDQMRPQLDIISQVSGSGHP